jgi:hypothetical protein
MKSYSENNDLVIYTQSHEQFSPRVIGRVVCGVALRLPKPLYSLFNTGFILDLETLKLDVQSAMRAKHRAELLRRRVPDESDARSTRSTLRSLN